MVTPDLLSFIETQLEYGASTDSISDILESQGWKEEDIKEALYQISQKKLNQQTEKPDPMLINSTILKKSYAGFWIRFAATAIDMLILFPPMIALRFYPSVTLLFLLPLLLSSVYFTLTTLLWGKSVGKHMMHLQIITATGHKPSVVQALLRELIGKTLSLPFLYGFLLIPLNKKKRGLDDYLAQTLVVITAEIDTKRKIFLFFSPLLLLIVGMLSAIVLFAAVISTLSQGVFTVNVDQNLMLNPYHAFSPFFQQFLSR